MSTRPVSSADVAQLLAAWLQQQQSTARAGAGLTVKARKAARIVGLHLVAEVNTFPSCPSAPMTWSLWFACKCCCRVAWPQHWRPDQPKTRVPSKQMPADTFAARAQSRTLPPCLRLVRKAVCIPPRVLVAELFWQLADRAQGSSLHDFLVRFVRLRVRMVWSRRGAPCTAHGQNPALAIARRQSQLLEAAASFRATVLRQPLLTVLNASRVARSQPQAGQYPRRTS